MKLKTDEKEFIGMARCDACDHLESLHNTHCCTFCMIDGCLCRWGEMESEDAP